MLLGGPQMENDYLIVSTKVLPDYLKKVIEAKLLLESHQVSNVTEASKAVGISRTTFYKYKDHVFMPGETSVGRRAVINMVLSHKKGLLSKVINCLSINGANIITISQSVPVQNMADVMVTIDLAGSECSADDLVKSIKEIPEILSVRLEAIG